MIRNKLTFRRISSMNTITLNFTTGRKRTITTKSPQINPSMTIKSKFLNIKFLSRPPSYFAVQPPPTKTRRQDSSKNNLSSKNGALSKSDSVNIGKNGTLDENEA